MSYNKIIRSSTPTHFFSTIYTDINLHEAESIEVYYIQDKKYVFIKSGDDISIDSTTTLSVKLKEEDTNKLDPTMKVYIRVLVIYPDGTRLPSANTICATVEDL